MNNAQKGVSSFFSEPLRQNFQDRLSAINGQTVGMFPYEQIVRDAKNDMVEPDFICFFKPHESSREYLNICLYAVPDAVIASMPPQVHMANGDVQSYPFIIKRHYLEAANRYFNAVKAGDENIKPAGMWFLLPHTSTICLVTHNMVLQRLQEAEPEDDEILFKTPGFIHQVTKDVLLKASWPDHKFEDPDPENTVKTNRLIDDLGL